MKKLLSLSLISAVLCTALITLSACGQEEAPPEEEENPPREEKVPPKEKEEEAPPEEETQPEEEDSPPEEETQPEEEETPPQEEETPPEEGAPIEFTDEQQQLIGSWQLTRSLIHISYSERQNGYVYTFMPDGIFIFEENEERFNIIIKNNDMVEVGECYDSGLTFSIVAPDKVHGTFQFFERERSNGSKINTVGINIACKGEKRLYQYTYEVDRDKEGSIYLRLDRYPPKCFEPCIDVFKKIVE